MNKKVLKLSFLLMIITSCYSQEQNNKSISIQDSINHSECLFLFNYDSLFWFSNPNYSSTDSNYLNLLIKDSIDFYIGKDLCTFLQNLGKNWTRSWPHIDVIRIKGFELRYENNIRVIIYFKGPYNIYIYQGGENHEEQSIELIGVLVKEIISEIHVKKLSNSR
jgi:hypothetical protein